MLGGQLVNKNLLLQPCMHQAPFDQVWELLFIRTLRANLDNTLPSSFEAVQFGQLLVDTMSELALSLWRVKGIPFLKT